MRNYDTFFKELPDGAALVRAKEIKQVEANTPFIPEVYFKGRFDSVLGPITGRFYPICADGFQNNDIGATKVCQALGFRNGSIASKVGATSDKSVSVGECMPEGSVTGTNCMAAHEVVLTQAGCDGIVQVTCSTPPVVRPKDMESVHADKPFIPEVYFKGGYYPICNIGFKSKLAKIVCQALGFWDATISLSQGISFPETIQVNNCSSKKKWWPKQTLEHCIDSEFSFSGYQCDAVQVSCNTSPLVRPKDMESVCAQKPFIPEVRFEGGSYPICNTGFKPELAKMICKALGFWDGIISPSQGISFPETIQVNDCSSKEGSKEGWSPKQTLEHCIDSEFTFSEYRCVAVQVTCYAKQPLVRPKDMPSVSADKTFIPEVYSKGGTNYYPICWDDLMEDGVVAKKLCKAFGFNDSSVQERNKYKGKFIASVNWQERKLESCSDSDFVVSNKKCTATQVKCSGPHPVRARHQTTVYANTPFTPEVYHEANFYPICENGFKNNNIGAKKVCQDLGFMDGSIAPDKSSEETSPTHIKIGEFSPEGSLESWSNLESDLTPTCDAVQVMCLKSSFLRARGNKQVDANMVFIPEVYYGGDYYPICENGFKNNDVGAKKVCQDLGFQDGFIATNNRTKFPKTVQVGECSAEENLQMCSKSRLKFTKKCVAVEVLCSKTPASTIAITAGYDGGNASNLGSAGVTAAVIVIILLLLIAAAGIPVWYFFFRKKKGENQDDRPRPRISSSKSAPEMIADEASNLFKGNDGLLLRSDEVVMEPKAIANGSGGQVFLGQFGSLKVALKENFASIGSAATMADQKETIHEAGLLIKLRHPNVVMFYGLWSPDGTYDCNNAYGLGARVLLVLEYCENGDLTTQIQDAETSLELRRKWTIQIADALRFLHSRDPPIVHRDIKPGNILLDVNNNAKVADFGTSKQQQERDLTTCVGTIAYMPPEILADSSEEDDERMKTVADGTKWDVFSYAVMVTYILSGQRPHEGKSNKQIFLKVGMRNERTPIPEAIKDDGIVDLIQRMWHDEPQKRPSFQQIMEELKIMNYQICIDTATGNDSDEETGDQAAW